MNTLPAGFQLCTLALEDVDHVLAIEQQVYAHPWSRGNFTDSLTEGYLMCGLRDGQGMLIGYFLAMLVMDEVHLLNLAVGAAQQGHGFSTLLMDRLCAYSREKKAVSILLEVRVRNNRAIQVYRHYGFAEIGRRKAYYPA
ncbi:ribosomal protein S18-alanine N-acetyltransferase, partial [Undibacterium sp.]|uniref:ribosomal protein S18-alanine N-acetyltransferase n=1 Tax=Undibacterium sp. TaxID=1914977 RepID=UPI00374CE3DC